VSSFDEFDTTGTRLFRRNWLPFILPLTLDRRRALLLELPLERSVQLLGHRDVRDEAVERDAAVGVAFPDAAAHAAVELDDRPSWPK
jgi:hypothetical protein